MSKKQNKFPFMQPYHWNKVYLSCVWVSWFLVLNSYFMDNSICHFEINQPSSEIHAQLQF